MTTLLAKGNGELLVEHLVATANKCKEYALTLGLEERLVKACYYAGLLHDIAKATPANQAILMEDKHEKVVHSYEGGLFISQLVSMNDSNELLHAIAHAVGYHHAKIEDNGDSLNREENFNPVFALVEHVLAEHKYSDNDNFVKLKYTNKEEAFDFLEGHSEDYQYLTSIPEENSYIFIISNVLKMADIVTSGGNLPNNSKQSFDVSDFTPNGWDKARLDKQKAIANAIKKDTNNIITAFCSFGKSVVGFLHCLKSDKKMYWVMPMNSIAISMFDELMEIDELFGNKLSIGLYTAHTQKHYIPESGMKESFDWSADYDIVITNIDNYWSPMLKTSENQRCFSLLERDCVFDEYHNYVEGQSSIFAGFKAIVDARDQCKNISSVYLTGTEPYLGTIFGKSDNYCRILEELGINSFEGNDKSIIIKKGVSQELPEGSVLFFNNSVRFTVDNARQHNIFCIHSRYTERDKKANLEFLMAHNGKHATEPVNTSTTSIISNGVDVSFDNARINNANWDLFYQLIGRVNRFNKCVNTPVVEIDMPSLFNENGGFKKDMQSESLSIPNSNSKRVINRDWASLFVAWRKTLSTLEHDRDYKISEIYAIREQFIKDHEQEFKAFQRSLLRTSEENLKKLEYKASFKKASKDDNGKFNSKNSIRYDGDALNVWCQLDEDDPEALINVSDLHFASISKNLDYSSGGAIYKFFKSQLLKEGFEGKALRQKCENKVEQHTKLCRYASTFAFPLFLFEGAKYEYDSKYGLEIFKTDE